MRFKHKISSGIVLLFFILYSPSSIIHYIQHIGKLALNPVRLYNVYAYLSLL